MGRRGKINSHGYCIEPNLTAEGHAIAVGGRAFVRSPNGVGGGYPSPGSNQSGTITDAVGTLRLAPDGETVIFVPDDPAALEAVEAADTVDGMD